MDLPNSSEEILLLHNPKCSKSRATLALLEERGTSFGMRLYLEEPLSGGELMDLSRRLGKEPIEFARTKQEEFKSAGLTAKSDPQAIFDVMAASPIIMERPILIRGDRAAIGRPPEDVLALLD